MNKKVLVYMFPAIIVIGGFIFGSYLYQSAEKEKLSFLADSQSELFVRDHSPRYGAKDAKVVLTEFLDPECESCRMFYPVVKEMLKEFGGKVQLVVRYAPFHGNSEVAIKALEAARMQGKYWEALELLFYYQPKWGSHHNPQPQLIFEYLPELDLDMEQLKKDMEAPKIQSMIEQDVADLKALGVRGTPTFFVNGKPLETFSMEGLHSLLKSEVDANYP